MSCVHALMEIPTGGPNRWFCVCLKNRKMIGLDEIPVDRTFSCRLHKLSPRGNKLRQRNGNRFHTPLKVYPGFYSEPPMPGTKAEEYVARNPDSDLAKRLKAATKEPVKMDFD